MAFGEFLLRCLESFKTGLISKTLDDVIAEYPNVDFHAHESYDPLALESADNNLMSLC